MGPKLTFLIVDDEKAIVFSLKALIAKSFPETPVFMAFDGNEGWNLIQQVHPRIVLCDITMPGMTGYELLKKIRSNEQFNNIYFVVLTADVDKKQRIRFLEEGADDFLTKPFSTEELLAKIRSASRFVELQYKIEEENSLLSELAEELNRSFRDMTLLAIKFLQARIPASIDMLRRVALASVWIGEQLGEFQKEDLLDIEIASYICYAGKMILPDSLVKKPVMANGQATDNLMYQVPSAAKEIVSSVRRFKEVALILNHIYENFDGTGFPDHLQSWQIPLGSRIIRTVLDFEEIRSMQKLSVPQAMDIIKRDVKRLYDHRIVVLLDQYLATVSQIGGTITERAVQLHELEDGMIVSRDIITNSGLKIVTAGCMLSPKIIGRILAHNSADPILGNVYIKV